MTAASKLAVVLLYKRDTQPDERLVCLIQKELASQGCSVFIDRHLNMGVEWAREIETRIRSADAIIPLLSSDSIQSEMLAFEIETAHETAQLAQGRPRLLPVRVNYTGPLPEPMASILEPIQYYLWEGESDDLGLVTELAEALKHLPEPAPEAKKPQAAPSVPHAAATPEMARPRPSASNAIGGAVPLDSEFYVTRPADGEMRTSILKRDSIVLIKGARQMGKTSLLARGMQFSREQGVKAVSTDLQKFNAENFKTLDRLYRTMAESLADQLDLKAAPADTWDPRRGPNANLERFLRREVLGRLQTPLMWALDEVDRLFVTPLTTFWERRDI